MKSSSLWRELKRVAMRFKHKFTYICGKTSSYSLFFDPWCDGNSLYQLFGNACLKFFELDSQATLDSIICNDTWRLPTTLAIQNIQAYNLISSINITTNHDSILWNGKDGCSNKEFKDAIFENYPDVDWYNNIWFKGNSINLSLFCWMAYIEGLKTSDNFVKRGIGDNILCKFCNNCYESHAHLFFLCSLSADIVRHYLPYGKFFLMNPTLQQVLQVSSMIEKKILKRLHCLITTVIVYTLWIERNNRMYGKYSSQDILRSKIKNTVAAKISNWKLKNNVPAEFIDYLRGG